MGIELEGEDETKKALVSLGKRTFNNLVRAVTIGVAKIEEGYKANIIKNHGVDTGNLIGSVGARVNIDENKMEVVGYAGAGAFYAAAYEFGLPATAAEINSPQFEVDIKEWAARKGFPEAAEAIIISIREKGTLPHPALMPAFEAARPGILQSIHEVGGQGAASA